jgi:NCS1 family nucleobase:cation symporter-1
MCYFLYWLIQFPFLFVTPHKIRWLFFAKGVLTPIAWLAMVIWAFVKVPASQGLFSQHATIEGNYFSWAWLSAMNSALGIYASLSVNIPDFTVSQMVLYIFCYNCSQKLAALRQE